MKVYHIYKSDKASKKFVAISDTSRIYFGAAGYSDYTLHKDPARKDRYDARHRAHEQWRDHKTAGFWAKWLLWNKPTIIGSARDIAARFNIKIHLHTDSRP